MRLPDNSAIVADKVGEINFQNSKLTSAGTTAHVLPHLRNSSLLSLGQLADDGCITVLEDHEINIFKKKNKTLRGIHHYKHHLKKEHCILSGNRNRSDGLWDINIQQTVPSSPSTENPTNECNVIIRKNQPKQVLAQYLHACAGFPPVSTFVKAIQNGNFITWPGITDISFHKHLPKSIPTCKGHLDQERQHLQSTSSIDPNPNKTYDAIASIHPFTPKHRAYGDLTGRFPVKSSRGNQYFLIIYDYDSNAILIEPLTSKTAGNIQKAWLKINNKLKRSGAQPNMYIMDNEASSDLKYALTKNNINYQLVPPHNHRRNAAERAIRTFKNHFLAILAGADSNYPISEWDRFVPQAELTLNLLRNARVNSNLSAHAYLFGNFNFNATPLAPLGTKVLAHIKPSQRGSWSYHGEEGWYIGPSMHHYRCVKCFFPSTRAVRDVDTVEFFPTNVPFPSMTTADLLLKSTNDILSILKTKKLSLPGITVGDPILKALSDLTHMLRPTDTPSSAKPPLKPSFAPVQLPTVVPITYVHPRMVPFNDAIPRVIPALPKQQNTNVHPRMVPFNDAIPRVIPAVPKQQNTIQFQRPAPKFQQFMPMYSVNHVFDSSGNKQSIDDVINKGQNKTQWRISLSNEIGRLTKGLQNRVSYTDTMEFIKKSEVPKDKKVTYANFVLDYRPLKSEPLRVRLTVGGDKLDYAYDTIYFHLLIFKSQKHTIE